jgi:tetratricopeptide (TPR) repeat protein
MSKTTRIGLGLIATLLFASLTAQAAKVSGNVLDDQGNPLKDVMVRVEPVEGSQAALEAKTKKKGNYYFAMVRRGAYRIVITAEGMRVAEVDVEVKDADGRFKVDKEGLVEPGSPLPEFDIGDTDTVKYDLVLTQASAGGGAFGTGTPLMGSGEIVKLIQGGKLERARAEIDNVLANAPDDPKGHYMLAYLEMQEENLDQALVSIDTCLEKDTNFPGARLLKAAILEGQGKTDEAMATYEAEAAAVDDMQLRLNAYVRMAILARELGQNERALEALEMIIDLDPSNTVAYAQLVDLYTTMGRTAELDALIAEAPAEIGRDATVHFNLAAAHYNEGKPAEAVASLEKVLEIDPQAADAYRLMGYCKVGLSDMDGAIEALKHYLELAPEAPDAGQIQALIDGLEKNKG